MIKITRNSVILLLPLLALVSGCSGDVKSKLGLRKESPDEFRVIASPPLSVPPNFMLAVPGTTRAPAPKVQAAQGTTQFSDSSGIIPAPVPKVATTSLLSSSESLFIDKAGASTVDPAIRDNINAENKPLPEKEEEKGYFKRLFSREDDKEKVVVDASAEKQRITENAKNNKPVTNGETPTVTEKRSFIDKLFGG
jgi:hypothetical protein